MKIRKYIPQFLIDVYHFSLAFLGGLFYRFPSRNIKVIGVTGTSGKSTTVFLLSKILEKSGYKVAYISSIKFKLGKEEWENKLKMTMPGRMKIQRFFRKAVNKKCDYAILEVTSEGVKQFRHKFIDFDVCCFLNLKPDHIESHGSFERYKEAKIRLFSALEKSKKRERTIVVNLDDESSPDFLKFEVEKKIGFTLQGNNIRQRLVGGLVWPEKINLEKSSSDFVIKGVSFHLNLPGLFNVQNALCAISVALSQGISLPEISKSLREVKKIEGRMEKVINKPFFVFVDYAHTPYSLEEVYKTLKRSYPSSSLICVLGAAGGGRDKWKRLVMGEIAKNYCDEIIITNEDPYDEKPQEIINQVARGTEGRAIRILDRKEAIRKALSLARENDVVIITGKGSEPWMCVAGGKKIPWDDRKIVREEFSKVL